MEMTKTPLLGMTLLELKEVLEHWGCLLLPVDRWPSGSISVR